MQITILDRYIARQVISTILLVALALMGLDIFFSLVNELKAVGKGSYTLLTAFSFLALTAPTRLYAVFPWAALLGTLIGMGAMANHRELVVMRTATISALRITWAVVKGALILLVFIIVLGEVIAPISDRVAQSMRTLALSDGQSIETAYGMWVRQGQDFIHIQNVRTNGELAVVTRYQFDDERKLKEVTVAETAIKQPEGSGWQLNNIRGTRFFANRTEVIQEKTQIIPELLDTEILETAAVKHPERLSLPALWRTIKNRSENELNAQAYELAFWTKVFQPLLIVLMVFLAMPFVFGPLRSSSMGLRILVGIFVAYLFHTVNGLFAPLAMVYQAPPLLAVLAPLAIFAGIGYFLIQRVK